MEAAAMKAWRVRFEEPGSAVTLPLSAPGTAAEREAILVEFRRQLGAAMARGGCRAFSVGLHLAGDADAECDHEVVA